MAMSESLRHAGRLGRQRKLLEAGGVCQFPIGSVMALSNVADKSSYQQRCCSGG